MKTKEPNYDFKIDFIFLRKSRVTQEALAAAQLEYFQGEVRKQQLEERKLKLQIRLLERLEEREQSLTAQDMLSALPFMF